MKQFLALTIIFSFALATAHAQVTTTFFGKKDMGSQLYEFLDLKSFRSSFGAKANDIHTLKDLVVRYCPNAMPKFSDKAVKLVCDQWLYEFAVEKRGDFTGDGSEDLRLRYVDRAQNGGSYNSSGVVTVSRAGPTAPIMFSGINEENALKR